MRREKTGNRSSREGIGKTGLRIYISSTADNQEASAWLHGWFQKQHHRVTSTWYDRPDDHTATASMDAAIDLIEIEDCDALVLFTRDVTHSDEMAFEAGFAMGIGKELFRIGPEVNQFFARYTKPWPGLANVPVMLATSKKAIEMGDV